MLRKVKGRYRFSIKSYLTIRINYRMNNSDSNSEEFTKKIDEKIDELISLVKEYQEKKQ